ncbi:sensor histidine kinase [Galbitalea soli]|uniref:histidine kinase n=1 Tax=Galbitalea soli TaxID=1268042 RepID=A0A7C9TSB3_9MICO|nr:HAMP domain-containing sensor histidine kinase [Galbitalea soli]NEM91543.1 HAMP domain-containing histidine kinase [Galbitalea soli]NYJ30237.1 two-component system sensor histidine kinase BaeS [Galbitalea soli]
MTPEPGARGRRPLGLRGRITLVTVAVATLAVLVTGVVSLQLVRQSSFDQARTQLAAQATLLARVPAGGGTAVQDRLSIALGDTEVGIIAADGSLSGPAAELLPPRLVRRALIAKVSTTIVGPNGLTLVEARPRKSGGALVLALPRASVEQQAQGALWRIALALGIGLVVAVVAGSLLARRLAEPLVAVARTARRMSRGERGIHPARTGPAEVTAVADALAALDVALATSESRQREFLLSISHELRTPLTALRGYAEAIGDGMIGPAELPGVGRVLLTETERLGHFVTDLLELARLESDDFSILHERVDVGALLRASRDAWQGRAASLGVELRVEAPSLSIVSDPRRVRQLVDGLVENALRVSPEGSAVSLSASGSPAGIAIEVRDGGPGISPEDAAVAFDRGVLHERYRDSRPVGTGLGLSIAARLAGRLGGGIRAESTPGGGAVFTVTLPAA